MELWSRCLNFLKASEPITLPDSRDSNWKLTSTLPSYCLPNFVSVHLIGGSDCIQDDSPNTVWETIVLFFQFGNYKGTRAKVTRADLQLSTMFSSADRVHCAAVYKTNKATKGI